MAAAFHEVQFPPLISVGATGGPGFHTTVLTLSSGFEQRNIDWVKVRATYDVSHAIKTNEQMAELISFFYARRGKAIGFRFKDWQDYTIPFVGNSPPVQAVFNTDGSTATFQLRKIYSDIGGNYVRDITKPVANTLVLYDNGVLTTDYSYSTTTGIVTLGGTLAATSGHVITGTCEFDVPVRFDVDELKGSFHTHDLHDWNNIMLVEVRI